MQILLYVLLGFGVLFCVLLAILLIRTLAFRPKAGPVVSEKDTDFDGDKVIERLSTLVRFPTVSYKQSEREDESAFQGLISSLPTLYPAVFAACEYHELPDRAILFRWKGGTVGDPAVMMAHYDVVPVNAEAWEKPPFDAVLEDGVLWGRGTLDTKVTFNAVLSAVDTLIVRGFVPERDVYLAFSGGEEVNGDGARNIVSYFKEKGITPALVVDEGGAVVEDVFPGVKGACGMIGIAEKGMLDVSYRTRSAGGHASAPKPHTPVGVLASACTKVENRPFPSHLSKPVAAMFDTLGRHSSFVYRMIFSNLWLFRPVLDGICKKSGGELNALMRTTVAFTQMKGSDASNVIPPEAEMVSNIRLNPADTVESALARLKKTVDDDSVSIEPIYGMDPSRISEIDCPAWDKVASAVASTWQGCIVTPYLMMQCSDSRHYGEISDKVYRFSAMDLTREERATIHGNNERIRVSCACDAVSFYLALLKQC
ncbi:MAG: M20/M25/M40 family metallo-hydrolase [Ruminococcaceae bacterium]|nr:M20/M25/M40 family metallo-hydrolase [Oscillospiraceae bacterium]